MILFVALLSFTSEQCVLVHLYQSLKKEFISDADAAPIQ